MFDTVLKRLKNDRLNLFRHSQRDHYPNCIFHFFSFKSGLDAHTANNIDFCFKFQHLGPLKKFEIKCSNSVLFQISSLGTCKEVRNQMFEVTFDLSFKTWKEVRNLQYNTFVCSNILCGIKYVQAKILYNAIILIDQGTLHNF